MPAKPKLLIACDYWHPVTSANLVCVEMIAPLLAEDYELVFVTADPEAPVYQGIEGRCVDDLKIKTQLDKYRDRPAALSFIKLANKFRVAAYLPRFPMRSMKMVGDYEKAIRGLLRQGGFAGVLAICYPGECVEACAKLRGEFPGISFVAYFLDEVAVGMYRKGKLVRGISSRAAVNFEKRAIDQFDGALFLAASKKLVEKNHHDRLNKVAFVDVPFMRTDKVTFHNFSVAERPLSILYAGTLGNPDRNPLLFIEALRSLREAGRIRLRFAGDSAGLLDGVDGVDDLGILSPGACDALMAKTDVLLSIGNRDPNLIPSKLFKYISLGKPIIHLKRGEGDSCLPYLEKYPLSCIVNDSDAHTSMLVREFLEGLPGKEGLIIPLKDLYPMAYPEYTVAAIETIAFNRDSLEQE